MRWVYVINLLILMNFYGCHRSSNSDQATENAAEAPVEVSPPRIIRIDVENTYWCQNEAYTVDLKVTAVGGDGLARILNYKLGAAVSPRGSSSGNCAEGSYSGISDYIESPIAIEKVPAGDFTASICLIDTSSGEVSESTEKDFSLPVPEKPKC